MNPILWRLRAYFSPGLPSPTISFIGYVSLVLPLANPHQARLFALFFLGLLGYRRLRGNLGPGTCCACNRGDGEVAFCDGGRNSLRKGDVGNMDAVANIEAGEVHRDLFRDGIGRAGKLDRMANDVQDPAALQAWRRLVIHELNGNLHVNARGPAHAEKVHMDGKIANRIDLDLPRNDPLLLAVDIEQVDCRQEASCLIALPEDLVFEGDICRVLFAAIDDAWYHFLRA